MTDCTKIYYLTLTRVVFEFMGIEPATPPAINLTLTRVVFECSSPSIISTKEINLTLTRVVFECVNRFATFVE